MKHGYFLGILALAAACAAFTGCNPATYGGGTGGGGGQPTPPIPSADYYVDAGIGPNNQVYGFTSSGVAGGGLPAGLTNSPYSTGSDGTSGAPYGIALAVNNTVLYAVNSAAGNISGFPVNPDASLGLPFGPYSTGGSSPAGICVDPASKFLVVVNTNSNSVQSFTIGAGGGLTPVNIQTTMLTSPVACAFASNSQTVYVSNSAGGTGVTAFTVSAGGTLAALAAYPIGTDNFQGIVATSTAVFAACQACNGVESWLINAGGSLTPQTLTSTAAGPIGIALSPNGSYLFVAAAGAQGVDVFSVNAIALSHLAGPYQTFTNGLSYVSVNAAGTLLAALNVPDHAVSLFSISSSGGLGFAPQAEYVFGSSPTAKAIVAR